MLKSQLSTRLAWWVRGGGLRPVAVVALLAALFVAFPDRNLSLRGADAASSSPACVSGVGVGGTKNAAVASTIGGHALGRRLRELAQRENCLLAFCLQMIFRAFCH